MPHTLFQTPLGLCGVAWNDVGLTAFRLPEPDGKPNARPFSSADDATPAEPPPWVAVVIARVQSHFAGEPQDFTGTRFDFSRVSSFQRAVYEAALTVKSGTTVSYGWLAAAIGQPPAASRAVGTALGQNPWPLLVPCHRFISADGKMTGFSAPGGIKTKLKLLALEGAELFAE